MPATRAPSTSTTRDLAPFAIVRATGGLTGIPCGSVAVAYEALDLQTPVRVETLADKDEWWPLEVRRRRDRAKVFDRLARSKLPADHAIIEAERERCRRDVKYWIDNYCWTKAPQDLSPDNPYRGTVPMVLWPRQRELIDWILEMYHAGRSGIVPKGRATGASWIMCMVIFWLCWHQRGFGALMISRKEDLVDDTGKNDRKRAADGGAAGTSTDSLFGKMDFILRCQPSWLRPRVELPRAPMEMRFLDTDALVTGESTNAGAGAGPRKSLNFVDEMAKMEPSIQTSLWRTLVAATGRSTIAVSSPGSPWARFETLRKDLEPDAVFEVDYDADPRRDEEWKRRVIANLGGIDDFLIEHGMRPVRPSAGRIWSKSTSGSVFYTDAQLFDIEPDARKRWQVFGAWDFGSGPSLLVCFLFLVEFRGGGYRLWLDQEMTWEQEDWRKVASDILDGKQDEDGAIVGGLRPNYEKFGIHFGDPSGIARESDQNSWVTNLQSGGVPVHALDGECNTRDQREWQIRKVGAMLYDGTLRVHERCKYALDCIDSWTRDIPKGQTVESSGSVYLKPKHDKWSHGGTALCFGVAGILPAASAMLDGGSGSSDYQSEREYGYHPAAPSYIDDGGSLDSILAQL